MAGSMELSRRALLFGAAAAAAASALPGVASASTLSTGQIQAMLDADGGWTLLDADADGVKLYQKSVTGYGVLAYKGVRPVAVRPQALFDTICDVPAHKAISGGVLAESVVLHKSESALHYYQVMQSPSWMPISDRYWFLQSSIRRDIGGRAGHHKRAWNPLDATKYAQAHSAVVSRFPDAVQVTLNSGSWEVQPGATANDSVLIYRIFSHPGGNISDSVASQVSQRSLPENMLKFEAAAKQRA
ncbi:hypothetical protein L6R49_05350 [Myxococcota bacterium]|nr:hypothetical protein [Myxococcota bacterium]